MGNAEGTERRGRSVVTKSRVQGLPQLQDIPGSDRQLEISLTLGASPRSGPAGEPPAFLSVRTVSRCTRHGPAVIPELSPPVLPDTLSAVSDYGFRFGGVERLYGATGLARLRTSHVLVVGVGGVGSWTVEALARSGVGRLTLVDLDEVCVSNVNRQLPALKDTVGQAKVEVMAARVRAINPEVRVEPVMEFFTAETADRLLDLLSPDGACFVVDAIDSSANKCRLIAGCAKRQLPVIVCGAAGGRSDPTQIRISDLARVTHDRLLSDVRRRLRREHGFPQTEDPWGVSAVHSTEPAIILGADGVPCRVSEVRGDSGESPRLNCQQGYGSAAFVTGAFGLAAAAYVVGQLTRKRAEGAMPSERFRFLPIAGTVAKVTENS